MRAKIAPSRSLTLPRAARFSAPIGATPRSSAPNSAENGSGNQRSPLPVFDALHQRADGAPRDAPLFFGSHHAAPLRAPMTASEFAQLQNRSMNYSMYHQSLPSVVANNAHQFAAVRRSASRKKKKKTK